eukprot:668666-Pelagomonas_calceolata.AAC.4
MSTIRPAVHHEHHQTSRAPSAPSDQPCTISTIRPAVLHQAMPLESCSNPERGVARASCSSSPWWHQNSEAVQKDMPLSASSLKASSLKAMWWRGHTGEFPPPT